MQVVKRQSAYFEKLIFKHVFNVRKTKGIAKFDGLEPRRYEDIKGIVAPEIGPKSFGTLEKRCGRYFNSSPSTPGRGKLLGLMLIFAGGKK